MELRLDGKVALVTGGSKGIGLAIGRAYAGAGASVLLSSRKQEGLEKAAAAFPEGTTVDVFPANAGEAEQAEACLAHCVQRFGGIDILVNNAAANPYYGPLMGIDAGAAEKTVRVNQIGYLLWSQLAVRAGLRGSILNVSSIGSVVVEPALAWYNVTKAAVNHLTRHLANELAPDIRVNALLPGVIRTDFSRALWESREEQVAGALPMKRVGTPEDVAAAALFLVSDAASWITGETLVVDGGGMVKFGL